MTHCLAHEYETESSPSFSSYPASTLDLGSEEFAGFIEIYSGSEVSGFGDFAATIGTNGQHGLLAHIKTLWKAIFEHFNSVARPNRQPQEAHGYIICIEKKGTFKTCIERVCKRKVRCKSIQLCGPCEPLLETVNDDENEPEISDQDPGSSQDDLEMQINEFTEFTQINDFTQIHIDDLFIDTPLDYIDPFLQRMEPNLYTGHDNVEQSTETLIDTPSMGVQAHPKINPRVNDLQRGANSMV